MRSREEIGRILLADLEAAKDRLRTAQEEFEKSSQDVPSGLPLPAGELRDHRWPSAKRQALYGLEMAVKRHTDFILHGTIPEDLLDESDKKETENDSSREFPPSC